MHVSDWHFIQVATHYECRNWSMYNGASSFTIEVSSSATTEPWYKELILLNKSQFYYEEAYIGL